MRSSTTPIPSPLKWVKGFAIFQLILGVSACMFFLWLFNSKGHSPFVLGMQEGVSNGLGESISYLSSPEGMGFIVGIFLIALLAPVFVLIAISRKSKGWSIAALVMYGGVFLTNPSPFAIAIFILILQKSSREYLQLSSK